MVASTYAEVVAVLGLQCSCRVWGAHAEIEVLKSPQSWPEHRNLCMSTSNSAWAPQSKHSNYLCIWGRHHQLDYLARPRKSSWATNYNWPWQPYRCFVATGSGSCRRKRRELVSDELERWSFQNPRLQNLPLHLRSRASKMFSSEVCCVWMWKIQKINDFEQKKR